MKHKFKHASIKLPVSLVLLLAASGASAAGMGLWEWDVSGIGLVSAGTAAAGLTASSETANPAQAVLFDRPSLNVGMVYLPVNISMSHLSSNTLSSESTLSSANSSSDNYIPDMHAIIPLHDGAAFTFGVTVPDGLNTNWSLSDWHTGSNYDLPTYSSIKVIDVNPGLAYQVTPRIAVAAGVNALYGQADYNAALNMPGAVIPQSEEKNHLTGTSFDWNAGILFSPSDRTRVGLGFRSSYHLVATGPSELISQDGQSLGQTNASADIFLPSRINLSLDQKINSKLDFLASIYRTNWSSMKELVLKNPASGLPITTDLHYKNVNLYSIGLLYRYTPKLTLLSGVGLDYTPVRDGYRDPRLPDSDRVDLGLGAQYKINAKSSLDMGFQKVMAHNVVVDDTQRSGELGPVNGGASKTNATVFGLSYNRDL